MYKRQQLFQKGAISKLSLDQAELAMVNAQSNLKYLTDQKSIIGRPAYVAERAEQAEFCLLYTSRCV